MAYRTNAEKRAAVKLFLSHDLESQRLGDQSICERMGVSKKLLNDVRRRLTSGDPEIPEKCTYFIQSLNVGYIKIGRAGDVRARLAALQQGSADILVLLGWMIGDFEAKLHSKFASLRLHGEWFMPYPGLVNFIFKCGGGLNSPEVNGLLDL